MSTYFTMLFSLSTGVNNIFVRNGALQTKTTAEIHGSISSPGIGIVTITDNCNNPHLQKFVPAFIRQKRKSVGGHERASAELRPGIALRSMHQWKVGQKLLNPYK
jgi:hypothetical protein